MDIYPVVLAGGLGTRLWPVSRESLPKQFLSFVGEKTLFQQTMSRAGKLASCKPLVVCNYEHYFHCLEQIEAMSGSGLAANYLLEPVARDTASAIALAALDLEKKFKNIDPVLLVMPADHLLDNPEHFKEKLVAAYKQVNDGKLVTFGIEPSEPATGYGYIEKGVAIDADTYEVSRFVEKPDLTLAKKYISAGSYLWNSGIFLFKASAYLQALKKHAPDTYIAAENAYNTAKSGKDFMRVGKEAYERCPKISIDYAVMEKADNIVVIPLDTMWSDLGCWSSVAKSNIEDSSRNVVKGDVVIIDSENCYLNAGDKMIAALGVKNQIIVATNDAVLVVDKDHAQNVKELVEKLKNDKHKTAFAHEKVHRPWGYYESLSMGSNYQVKYIVVKPHSRLSLQLHQHRAEHWVVVSGKALVTNDGLTIRLEKNQSTYIPKGAAHRLANETDEPLIVVEVQSGEYLGEDDIVRLQDDYARAEKKAV